MVPATRGRSSTNSVASSRPLNSSLSDTERWTAGATLTGIAGGGPPWASADLPHAASHDAMPSAKPSRASRVGVKARGKNEAAGSRMEHPCVDDVDG